MGTIYLPPLHLHRTQDFHFDFPYTQERNHLPVAGWHSAHVDIQIEEVLMNEKSECMHIRLIVLHSYYSTSEVLICISDK